MSELSKQLELLDLGSVEIALLYDGLTELRKRCVKMVVYSFSVDMKNPYSTFEADLQRDLDRAKKSEVGFVSIQEEAKNKGLEG